MNVRPRTLDINAGARYFLFLDKVGRTGLAQDHPAAVEKLMVHANIPSSQHHVSNLPVGANESVMLKNQRRYSRTVPTLSVGIRAL